MEKIKFLDLFSGIGGFRSGLESLGHEAVGYVEWDKHARASYEAIYDTEGEWTAHDITTVTDQQWQQLRGKVNLIAGGSPCQSFSIAGNRKGFEDTRGTMFFQYANAVKNVQPEYFLFENVKGLLSHDKQETIKTMLKTFDQLGYAVDFDIFNSKNYGVPQSRDRIFILGKRKDLVTEPEYFDINGKKTLDLIKEWANANVVISKMLPKNDTPEKDVKLKDILEENIPESYYLSEEKVNQLTYGLPLQGGDNLEGNQTVRAVISPDRLNKNQKGRRFKGDGEPSVTLTGQDRHGIAIKEATKKGYTVAKEGDSINIQYPESKTRRGRVGDQIANTLEASGVNQAVLESKDNYRIRKLTPLECWRLQGFTDEQFYKAAEKTSSSQLYKQAGNSVTVNVIRAIISEL